MPFSKIWKTPNGANTEFHKVTKIESSLDMTSLHIAVSSWSSEAEYLAGAGPVWTTYETRPLGTTLENLLAEMLTNEGVFVSAVPVVDNGASLEAAKARKRAEINTARLAANRSTFTFAGKEIQCDELSRSDIDGVQGYVARHSLLPASFPGGWKTVDNSFVAIPDVETWDAFYGAMLAQGTANFMKAQGLKADVDAATTIEEVNAVMW